MSILILFIGAGIGFLILVGIALTLAFLIRRNKKTQPEE